MKRTSYMIEELVLLLDFVQLAMREAVRRSKSRFLALCDYRLWAMVTMVGIQNLLRVAFMAEQAVAGREGE
ncbi:hypothetical protein [Halodesulfovibrio aestuarii]|uniref:hypothetical protein n=1 Tax=Halodesulfovibrio aestuarii TaxID=126333 RepID=UPI003D32E738